MGNNINNLHSLLGGKWMIDDQFANSLAPYLISILQKGKLPKADTTKPVAFNYITANGIVSEVPEEEDKKYVAVLSIKGPILKYSQFCGPTGTKAMMSRMDKWSKDDSIVGVLLDFDSGGGQVSGTGEFAKFIHNYNKPVVSYTDGMICSAAYYLASGSKEIFANENADCIGSIGTMIKYLDLDGYYEKLGAKVIEVYASKSTHKNNAFRKAKDGDLTAMIKEELDPINEVFHNHVLEYRPQVKKENLNGHHTSDINQAKELGLIDTIGTKQNAIDRIFELAEQNNQNQNNPDMSKENKKFDQIAAVIGQEDLQLSSKILTGKKGVFLTEAQLDDLEQKLEGHDAALKSEKDIIATKIVTINTLEATVTSIQGSVTDALATADLEAGEDTEASVKLLGEKVKEYGAQPGATGTTVISGGDRNPEEQDTIVNSNDGHNQLYKSL
ncbi:S49 family peptidase [Aquimarina algiphila]|uniref:Peptidase S49 domain-containing protein n=1 Tax=Aquimarina algiphila TaxID=2047982 RepID=A0A554VAS8_9FLAO|nr:S49 family peptidase [Aquimarina algiphila]TSE03389.1 hypothetical protein FOF46_29420 [Aquimarina algiphila]